MIYLDTDYMVGAHPDVMRLLQETNGLHTVGYGNDDFSREAKALILKECGLTNGEVFFTVGGTQTNLVVIDRLLSRNDGVIAADSAHISVHEAGAIEATGHKVIELKAENGKLKAQDVESYVSNFYADDTHTHMVRPALVYISFPTELGTVYAKQDLEDLYEVCKKWDMLLYLDGARLAYGLAAEGNQLSLRDIAERCDVFYIGGTKCGTLFGEAVVTKRPELFRRFFSLMKMNGAVLAKGRLQGVQFKALFEDGLYYRIGQHAVMLALRLKEGFRSKGYSIFMDSPTNQQFVVIDNHTIDRLKKDVSFEFWGPKGETQSVVRFVTDWSTSEEDIDKVLSLI